MSYSNINDLISKFDKTGELLSNYEDIEISDHIHTGNYLFNAHISGSLLRGFPIPKAMCIAGDPKTGKSYLLLNMCREAQKMGYFVWLIETEGSPDKSRLENQNIDFDNMRISQPDSISEVQAMILPFLKDIKNSKKEDRPKVIIAIDSISGLSSQKVFSDTDKGKVKTDMGTEAKEMGALMKAMVPMAGKAGIPIIFTAHTYDKSDMFGNTTTIPSGGRKAIYMASIVTILKKKQDKEYSNGSYVRKGIEVKSLLYEGRYSKPVDTSFYISYIKGMNPYIGLHDYVSWDNCGIDKGSIKDLVDPLYEIYLNDKKSFNINNVLDGISITYEDLLSIVANNKKKSLKSSMEWMKDKGYMNELDDGSWSFNKKIIDDRVTNAIPNKPTEKIAVPNPNSNVWVAKHLDQSFTFEAMFNEKVFTQKVLQELDDNVIKNMFMFNESDYFEENEIWENI